jgi:hypothetical protein
MNTRTMTPFQQALKFVEQLSVAYQEALLEVVRRRLVEQRRRDIAANAQATLQALHEGRASYGTLDDLRRDLTGGAPAPVWNI